MVQDLSEDEAVILGTVPIVKSMVSMLFAPCWAEHRHASSCCELLYVLEGNVQLVTEDANYIAGPGDLLFVPKGMLHRDDFDLVQGLRVYIIFFDWVGEQEFMKRVSNDFLCTMQPRQKQIVAKMLKNFWVDVRGDSLVEQLIVRSRLLTVFTYLLREAVTAAGAPPTAAQRRSNRQRHPALMQAAKSYLDRHYAEAVSLGDIADALNVSTFHLSHIFSQESNFSLFKYLTTVRMEKAGALLCEGRMNINEVARAVGYENSNYFSKVFRKHFHCSPSDYLAAPSQESIPLLG